MLRFRLGVLMWENPKNVGKGSFQGKIICTANFLFSYHCTKKWRYYFVKVLNFHENNFQPEKIHNFWIFKCLSVVMKTENFMKVRKNLIPSEARPKAERSLGNCVEKEENGWKKKVPRRRRRRRRFLYPLSPLQIWKKVSIFEENFETQQKFLYD